MTTLALDDLPSGVLIKVLSLLDEFDVNILADVSRKWEFLIEKFVGYDVLISPRRDPDQTHGELPEVLSRFRLRRIWMRDSGSGRAPVPEVKYPEAVQFLQLHGSLRVHDFNTLVSGLINLCDLRVGWFSLYVMGKAEAWYHFPNVKYIHFGAESSERSFTSQPSSEILINLSGLIGTLQKVVLPKLKSATVDSFYHVERENMFFDALITFLTRHQQSLRELVLELAFRRRFKMNEESRCYCPDWPRVPNLEQRLKEVKLDLRVFMLHFYPYRESALLSSLIDQISSSSTGLERWIVLRPSFRAFFPDLVEDNFRTLKSLSISMWIFEELDCKVFESCSALQVLLLRARPKKFQHFESELYLRRRARSELVNMSSLPSSLTSLQVVNFFIETEDLSLFTTSFPNLEFLSLQGIGEKEGLGMSLDVFSRLLAQPRLRELEVFRGLNKNSLSQAQSGNLGGPLAFLALGLRQTEGVTQGTDHILSLRAHTDRNGGVQLGTCSRAVNPNRFGFTSMKGFSKKELYEVYDGPAFMKGGLSPYFINTSN